MYAWKLYSWNPHCKSETRDEAIQQSRATPSTYVTDVIRHNQAILQAVWTASTYDTITPNDKLREKHLHSRLHSSIKKALSQIHVLQACCQRSSAEQVTTSKLSSQHPNSNLADTSRHQKRESQLEAAAVEATPRAISHFKQQALRAWAFCTMLCQYCMLL